MYIKITPPPKITTYTVINFNVLKKTSGYDNLGNEIYLDTYSNSIHIFFSRFRLSANN